MTNAVVWLEAGTEKVWAIADSLITATGTNPVRRVTNQAMKIMKMHVGAWGQTKYTIASGPMIGYEVGMAYAGAVTPALMTHATASMMLKNLHPQTKASRRIYAPSFHRIAELVRMISERYTREAMVGQGNNNPPFCEFVIFAVPPAQSEDLPAKGSWDENLTQQQRQAYADKLNRGSLDCYWIHPKVDSLGYRQVAERVNLLDGEYVVIGDQTATLRTDIESLKASPSTGLVAEPRIALAARILAGLHDTVGGTLQFGLMEQGRLGLFGAMQDAYGDPAKNWLGFECETDINPVLGMPVVIPSQA
ncbi:hypothetical protein [Xanthomonas sp. A1809]|uniref:hypothetical protein n=1 Tax=Xanthomonas sp. A1809 TaxID=2821275 RepID=UPI001AD9DE2F|nr:hypothetical protein [Xanthomonas sp. A1809]MBO9858830.1 hypothetical protein [Xanthomonas sp. A1809]